MTTSRYSFERQPLILPVSNSPNSSLLCESSTYAESTEGEMESSSAYNDEYPNRNIRSRLKLNQFKEKCKVILTKLETKHEPGLSHKDLYLQNEDLLPVEPERRQWGWINFVTFWIADSFNINTWQIASTGVVAGLSWWQVWIGVWIGYACAAIFVVISGSIGGIYHIPFPVIARAPFGWLGSLPIVLLRGFTACCWYGAQAWLGGITVKLMLLSIFPNADKNIPNGMEGSGTTTFDFMCFFLFWLCSLPAIWFPVHKIRHLFTAKSILVPFAGIGFLIWTIVRAGGIGPVIHQKSTLQGSEFSWTFIATIMNSIANFATLIVNSPDFTRFATHRSSCVSSQLLTIPISFAITSFIGVMVSSASTVLVGETLWSPLDVLLSFLNNGNSSAGTRCGVFFIAAVFSLAQLGTNISANSISAGTDLTALIPRFISIRRGGYICAAVGLFMCPWVLFESSNRFTTYLSAFSVFFSAIAGIIICDFYLVRKGYLNIKDLYSCEKTGVYYHNFGISWRAYTAYGAGIIINIIGFAGAAGGNVPKGATYIFNLNFFAGFLVSGIVYYAICWISPPQSCFIQKNWSLPSPQEIDLMEGFITTAEYLGVSPQLSCQSDDDSTKANKGSTTGIDSFIL